MMIGEYPCCSGPLRIGKSRTLVATSHEGRYALYLDSGDRYIYQLRTSDRTWMGCLCSQAVWESTFSAMGGFQLASRGRS